MGRSKKQNNLAGYNEGRKDDAEDAVEAIHDVAVLKRLLQDYHSLERPDPPPVPFSAMTTVHKEFCAYYNANVSHRFPHALHPALVVRTLARYSADYPECMTLFTL